MFPRLRIPRAWWPALSAWVVSVVGYGLVLMVVTLIGLHRFQVWEMNQVRDALAAGDTERASMLANSGGLAPFVPWADIAAFAAIGACALAVAWAGFRWAALVLPALVTVMTVGPAVSWFHDQPQPLVAHPFGEGGGYSLWTVLVAQPASDNVTLPSWPYHLGTAIQLVALLIPILFTPRVRAVVPLRHVATLAAFPIAVAALLGLATSSGIAGYTDVSPVLLAMLVAVLAGLIASGRKTVAPYVLAIVLPAGVGVAVYPVLADVSSVMTGNLPAWSWLVVSALTVGWFAAAEHLRRLVPQKSVIGGSLASPV